jgi:hypothetical protein
MNLEDIMQLLESLGTDQTKKILAHRGAREPLYGVKTEEIKKIVKRVKTEKTVTKDGGEDNHQLALKLYETGNFDAMCLAGMLADSGKMDRNTLQKWVEGAYCYMLSEYTVAGIASAGPYGWELGLEWIGSGEEMIAAAGWSTLALVLAITPNDQLDVSRIKERAEEIGKTLHHSPNRVRYTMNIFLICMGCYIPELTSLAKSIGLSLGKVKVDMGGTACKVPYAPDYIAKVENMGRVGQKKKPGWPGA